MSISKLEGDAALDALADLIEPAAVTFGDPQMRALIESGQKIEAIKYAIKEHKREVTEILAVLEGKDPAKYKPRLLTLPIKLMEIINDDEIQTLFFSQASQTEIANSGSTTENTEALGE